MIETTEDALLAGKILLRQPAKGHRAGTDAVLLAAAARLNEGDVAMDIGAATGAVALMAASRVTGIDWVLVERDPELGRLCGENCEQNGLSARIVVSDVLDKAARRGAGLMPESADAVLTNPPFLEEGQSRLSPDARRAAAHALPPGGLEAWLAVCLELLRPKGRFAMIHRAERLADCLAVLSGRLGGMAVRAIHPQAEQPAIRILITGTLGSRAPLSIEAPVILHTSQGRFTPQAEALHRGETALV